jgi:long-chain acyl-CoA synthetase
MKKFDSPIEALEYWATETPDSIFLRQPINGKIQDYTYQEGLEQIRRLASGLKSLSLPEKSNIALLSKNCAQWFIADMAIIMAGHVSVPIYPTLNAESISKILDHSESKLLIVGKMDNYDDLKPGLPDIKKLGIETYGIKEEYSWEKIIEDSSPIEEIPVLDKDDLITIMYTSGTTGKPKGVMHTVGNFSQTSNTAIDIIELPERPRFFSYLPLSHVAERIAIEIHGIFRGGQISFPESLETFPAACRRQ